ncbi:PP2C family protein-serine/threonine phosphatase [Microbacterium sp. UBA837]|uniref:PP2C family protein-serine/threonine phosphatase n=1 Tax=Microbacterium sp. UBA837 TaxID=1946956 RepID=UPI0025D2A3E5|nr:protein phosphatase 2C domain-containing protein [Microbacterium sp. UBA837]|tara:strand:- start:8772 stop:9575 length:804 start_codon:yes stop_codon:yes gene_type:complete
MTRALELAWGVGSDRGLRRAVNEDSFLATPPLFLVADGMGGHEAGAEASRAAIEGFRALAGRDSVSVEEIEAAFVDAVAGVSAIVTERAAAGTTLAGAAVCEQGGEVYWLVLNIGDSRTYRLQGGTLEQISVDHSAVQDLVERGELAQEDAERHPERNVVTRAVGAGSVGVPDYWLLPARAGDRLMICSDGLPKELSFDQILEALRAEVSPQAAATRLVHEALVHGGRDNVTVVVVDAHGALDETDDEQTQPVASPVPSTQTKESTW